VTVTAWRKSSFSYNGTSCVEVGSWRKSSHSALADCLEAGNWKTSSRCAGNGSCVEASACCHGVAVRDTTDREGPVVKFSAEAWADFLARTRADAGTGH
jgi:hypothetical protein